MAEIRTVLLVLPNPDLQRERLAAALGGAKILTAHRLDSLAIRRGLRLADVAFLPGDLDKRYLEAPGLRWVHCGHAGLEHSALPETFQRKLLVTSAAGRSAPALAEHAMFFMLALSFRYGDFFDAQRERRWGIRGQRKLRALHGQTLGIIGLGHTGSELAARAKVFGMKVMAYRRKPLTSGNIDQVFSADQGDRLEQLLVKSDYVVLALPLTDRTYHLIGEEELSLMHSHSRLINIARGGLVNEKALIRALETRSIAGAAIDVAGEEPLPESSPLWSTPNLLITPHVTPRLADRDTRATDILVENIRRYREDLPLLNQLTAAEQFSPREAGHERDPNATKHALRISRFLARLTHRYRTR